MNAGLASAASAAVPGERPDPSFTEEEYQKPLALQEDGDQRMTLSAFRSRIAEQTEEYRDLLERFSQSEILYALRDTHELAAFLFYELPLAGEGWRTRSYGGEAVSSRRADAARLEYTFTMTVLKADAVMLKDYDDMRPGIVDAMQSLLVNLAAEEEGQDSACGGWREARRAPHGTQEEARRGAACTAGLLTALRMPGA